MIVHTHILILIMLYGTYSFLYHQPKKQADMSAPSNAGCKRHGALATGSDDQPSSFHCCCVKAMHHFGGHQII
jgi:hypothetical protein